MVSCCLQRRGKRTTSIDIRSQGFDERAINEGVNFLQIDAAHLAFGDEHFDFVFSYDSFEHFPAPDLALREAIRVVKTGGYIYLDFGPLYMSPMGFHAYDVITVPFCQFLFPKEQLKEYAGARELGTIDFSQVNGWSLEDYRKLFDSYLYRLRKIVYYELLDVSALDLIQKYPSCFKSKTRCFDNLIVPIIKVLFMKIV